jgi:hypothetical protein
MNALTDEFSDLMKRASRRIETMTEQECIIFKHHVSIDICQCTRRDSPKIPIDTY